jgi:hypothetical protein
LEGRYGVLYNEKNCWKKIKLDYISFRIKKERRRNEMDNKRVKRLFECEDETSI